MGAYSRPSGSRVTAPRPGGEGPYMGSGVEVPSDAGGGSLQLSMSPSAGVPGGARYGRPQENGPTLSPNQVGRYGPTERFNLWQLVGSTTAAAGWTAITVDKPTLLIPVSQLSGSVFFTPHAVPLTLGSIDPRQLAQKGEGPGVMYLWAPGTWWCKYQTANNAYFRQVSAEDPAIVASVLSLPGYQNITKSTVTTTGAASDAVLTANPYRRRLVMQSTDTGWFRFTFGGAATATDGHYIQGNGSVLDLSGQACPLSGVNVWSSVAGKVLTVMEYE